MSLNYAELPPYKKLLQFSRENGACRNFLARAERCTSYEEAVEREGINLMAWFWWLSDFFTHDIRAEYKKALDVAWNKHKEADSLGWDEYKEAKLLAWIRCVNESFS